MSWEMTEDEERASFEVVAVADLPPVDRLDIAIVPVTPTRPCGCYWCQYNWRAIAGAAVKILKEGIDPLDHNTIDGRAVQIGLDADKRGLLLTLSAP